MKYVLSLIAYAIISLTGSVALSSPRCKNQEGKDVDWFIMYKLPRNTNGAFKSEGGEFMYIDAVNSRPNGLRYWPLSKQDIFSDRNPVAFTLQPLYETTTRQDILYFVYNDQPPSHIKGTRAGHSKGVVLFDNDVGVWLLHSAPRFVDGLHSGRYSFPNNARSNGQMFMCVTFRTSEVDKIARMLRTEYANVYASRVPPAMKVKYREVEQLSNNRFVQSSQETLYATTLTSEGGLKLNAYAKRATARQDLHFGVLAKALQGPIAVQAWFRGAGTRLPNVRSSTCSVFNIEEVIMRYDAYNFVKFSGAVDHSKWAVSIDKDVFCFASMNRMESQANNRGGEALCFENPAVKALFRRSAVINQQCSVDESELRNTATKRARPNKRTNNRKRVKTQRTQDPTQTSNDRKVEMRRPKSKKPHRGRA